MGEGRDPEDADAGERGSGGRSKSGAARVLKEEAKQESLERSRTSLEAIFTEYEAAREGGTAADGYKALRKAIAREAPAIITLGLMPLPAVVTMLGTLEDKISGGGKGGKVRSIADFLNGKDEGEGLTREDGGEEDEEAILN